MTRRSAGSDPPARKDPGAPRRRSVWLLAYAVATPLAFPQPWGDGVLDLGPGLAWGVPVLLLAGLSGLSPRRGAGLGFVAGLLAHAAVFHWFYVAIAIHGQAPPLVGALTPLVPAAYVATFVAGFGGAWCWLARSGLAGPFAAALLWTSLELLRSFALSGFPWATLGYAQSTNGWLLPLAAYTGVYGLSFTSVLGGSAAARIVVRGFRGQPGGAQAWIALGGVAVAHGLALLVGEVGSGEDARPRVRVAALQGNIGQGVKWSPAGHAETRRIYAELTRAAVGQGAQIVVWPESAVPGGVAPGMAQSRWLPELAAETGAVLVVGAVGLGFDEIGRPVEFYDSAFAVDPIAGFAGRYDKSKRVPFGEYLPLREWLGSFVSAIARGIAPVDVSPGSGPHTVVLSVAGAGAAQEVKAGIPICYELLFPDLVRRFAADGAQVLFAITNDAWYGKTGAPLQFLAMTAVRAAESGVFTVRAANTGVSAVIDHRGWVLQRTSLFERDVLVADVALGSVPPGGTFYARHGDVFARACGLCTALLMLYPIVGSRAGTTSATHARKKGPAPRTRNRDE